jgi:hypothetical protein
VKKEVFMKALSGVKLNLKMTLSCTYSVFGIHLGQNRDGKQGRLGILLSLTVVKSAVREFVYVEIIIDRKMYSCQYMNANNNLVFRYDNTEHHKKLNLSTFPHHKHDGSEYNVVESNCPFLAEILKEIEEIVG